MYEWSLSDPRKLAWAGTIWSALTSPVIVSRDFPRAKDSGDTFSSVGPSACGQTSTHIKIVDVTCQEICVFCFKRFYLASEFIRHTPKHPDDESVKSIFMRDTSQMLRDRVAGELEAKQKSSKRAWRDATLDQNMARAKKARQNAVDFRSIDSQIHLGDQRSMEHANPYHLESATMFQFAAPLELEHQQAQLLDTNFTDPHATVLYPTDLEQAAQMSADLDNFDAPVYAILSGPPIWSSQTGWIQEVPGGDTLNNGQLYHQVS